MSRTSLSDGTTDLSSCSVRSRFSGCGTVGGASCSLDDSPDHGDGPTEHIRQQSYMYIQYMYMYMYR